MKLGLREANQHFSKAIKAVRAGRDVVLTDRGQPIAVIKPIRTENEDQAALQAMVDEGLISPALHQVPMPVPRWRPVKAKGRPVSRTIIEDREERS